MSHGRCEPPAWLARTQAQAGDVGKARLSYEEFLSAWSEADRDLKPIIEARQELARLASDRAGQ